MKKFNDDLIEEIKLNNDILDIVSEYVKLSRKGKDYFGLCPFHQEKTPSFSVAPGKGIYYCFGCNAGGSVIQFIMNIENLNFVEALELLAKKANIVIPEEVDPKYIELNKKKERILEINKKAAHFYYDNLKNNKTALGYLAKRNIKNEAVIKFGLGYANEKWDDLFDHLTYEGFSAEDIFAAGLVSKNKNGGYYDKFRNRVIFPIFDVYGSVIAFGGRVLDNSIPKYLNSPETPVYRKGKHLYGLNFAKKSNKDFIAVVEGYIDVVTLYQAGIDCFVASLGTALTQDQVRLLNRYDKKVILSYDNDNAGNQATLKALDSFLKIGVFPLVMLLEDCKDPDEYLKKHGIKKLEELIDNALTPVEFKILLLKKKYSLDNTQEKIELFKELINIISEIDDMTQIDLYASKYSKEFKISKDAIINDVNRHKGNNSIKKVTNVGEKPENSFDKRREYELILLLFYFNHKIAKERIEKYFDRSTQRDEVIDKIFDLLFNSKRDVTLADVMDRVDKKHIESVYRLNEMIENIEKKEKALEDFFDRLQNYDLEVSRDELMKKIKTGKITQDELKEYQKLVEKSKKNKER